VHRSGGRGGTSGGPLTGLCPRLQVIDKINGRLGGAYALDREWMEATDKRATQVSLRRGSPRPLALSG